MELFIIFQRKIDSCENQEMKQNFIREYFHTLPLEDIIWTTYFLSEKSFKKIYTLKEFEDLYKKSTSIPEWLFEICTKQVGNLPEAYSLIHGKVGIKISHSLSMWLENYLFPFFEDIPENRAKKTFEIIEESTSGALNLFFLWILGKNIFKNTLKITSEVLSEMTGTVTDIWITRLESQWNPNLEEAREWFTERRTHSVVPNTTHLVSHNLIFPVIKEISDLKDLSINSIHHEINNYFFSEVPLGILVILEKKESRYIIHFLTDDTLNQYHSLNIETAYFWNDWKDDLMPILEKKNHMIGFLSFLQDHNAIAPRQWIAELKKTHGLKKISKKYEYSFRVINVEYLEEPLFFSTGMICNLAMNKITDLNLPSELSEPSKPYLLLPAKINRKEDLLTFYRLKPKKYSIRAVLLYATLDRSIRQFNEFTFALRCPDKMDNTLIPVGRIKSTLNGKDKDIVEKYIKSFTVEKFGPTYSLVPGLIFEISYSQVHKSKRHKSGFVLEGMIIQHYIQDAQIDSVDDIKNIISQII